jgi:hypothetical protein
MTRPQPPWTRESNTRGSSDSSASPAHEARRTVRNEYPYLQRYAMYREGRWPTDEEFRFAELCDISSKGLALLLQDRPAVEMLVVELGVGTNVSQVLVKIVQISPNSTSGEKGYRVGCELVSSGTTF